MMPARSSNRRSARSSRQPRNRRCRAQRFRNRNAHSALDRWANRIRRFKTEYCGHDCTARAIRSNLGLEFGCEIRARSIERRSEDTGDQPAGGVASSVIVTGRRRRRPPPATCGPESRHESRADQRCHRRWRARKAGLRVQWPHDRRIARIHQARESGCGRRHPRMLDRFECCSERFWERPGPAADGEQLRRVRAEPGCARVMARG